MARRGRRAILVPILAVLVQAAAPAPAEDLFAVVDRAGKGHADSQFRMGLIYLEGDIVSKDARQAAGWFRKAAEQDHREAVRWYRKAAGQGHANGQFNLAVKYLLGEGVTKDLRATASWYRKAADQGLPIAQHNLGVMHRDGIGVARDGRQARDWFRKAAEQGDALAQTNLGALYIMGDGVKQDDVRGYAWTSLGAEQGNEIAKDNRAMLRRTMTTGDLLEAFALAVRLGERIRERAEAAR